MMKEWTDRLEPRDAIDVWQRSVEQEMARRLGQIEQDLQQAITRTRMLPAGFFDAMRNFLTLREKLFPNLPADPALKILVILAQSSADSDRNSVTGIAVGADVPLTTALRYLAIMELDGIVERVPDPADRRRIMIRLTDEGRARLNSLAESWAMKLALTLVVPATMILYVHQAWAR